MEMLQGVWKQHLRPRAVVGYGVKIFLSSPPNYVTRSPGDIFAYGPNPITLDWNVFQVLSHCLKIFGTRDTKSRHSALTLLWLHW